MKHRIESEPGSGRLVAKNQADSKILAEKRGGIESGCEDQHSSRKRVKMRDLELVCRPDGVNSQHNTSLKTNEDDAELRFDTNDECRAANFPARLYSYAAPRPLDLNTEMCGRKDKASDDGQECSKSYNKRESDSNFGTSKGIGLDLNSEDVSSSMIPDPLFPDKNSNQLKPRDISECASSTGPLEENDPLKVWKQMKENGFLSASHGGIPIPKQRVKKTKTDVLKKKMEIAKREQVDRFTKIAAPSGLLNDLNPGIINHVRNRKQVHSIIKALVRSEKHENSQVGNKQSSHSKGVGTDIFNSNVSAIPHLSREDRQANTASWVRQARGFPTSLVRCPSIVDSKGVESDQTTGDRLLLKTGTSQSTLVNREDALALKMSENESSLSNEDSAVSLTIKAASVAAQWLELLQQDIKGRLAALRRSKKRVRAVISTELPFLLSKEFVYDQENDPHATKTSADKFSQHAVAEMHRSRWNRLFDQMDKSLSEEERHLDSWLNQVKEMQVHCEQGLHQVHANTVLGFQQFDFGAQRSDTSEREMAVRAAAASIYSTCNYILTENNVSCF